MSPQSSLAGKAQLSPFFKVKKILLYGGESIIDPRKLKKDVCKGKWTRVSHCCQFSDAMVPTLRPRVHRILLVKCVSRAPEIVFLFPSSGALLSSPTLPLSVKRDADVITRCHFKFKHASQHWTTFASLVKIFLLFYFHFDSWMNSFILLHHNWSEISTFNTPNSSYRES